MPGNSGGCAGFVTSKRAANSTTDHLYLHGLVHSDSAQTLVADFTSNGFRLAPIGWSILYHWRGFLRIG